MFCVRSLVLVLLLLPLLGVLYYLLRPQVDAHRAAARVPRRLWCTTRYALSPARPRLAHVPRTDHAWGPGASHPEPSVRTARRRLVRRLSGTYVSAQLRRQLHACMARRGEIGDFGGSSLEHPRQWLGSQWLGFPLGVPSRPEPPGAPCGGTGAELWHCPGCTLCDHAAPPRASTARCATADRRCARCRAGRAPGSGWGWG